MKTAPHALAVPRLTLSALAAAAFFSSQATRAATLDEWKGAGTSVTWATAGNWVGGTPTSDLTTNTALFNSTSYSFQPNAGTASIAGIQIGDGTTATANLTLAGTALTIGGGGITKFANSGTTTISSPVKLGASQSWANNSSSLLTVSGTVSNVADASPFTLTLNGSGVGGTTFSAVISNAGTTGTTGLIINTTGGTTTLSANNTYTGATTITAGTLQIGTGSTSGKLAATGTIANNGVLIFNRSNNVTQGTDFSNAGITGSGQLIQNGTGLLTLNAANNYSGGTIINSGLLQFTSGALPSTGLVTINSAGVLYSSGALTTVTGWLSKITTDSSGVIALTGNSSENIDFTGYSDLILGASAASTYNGTLTPDGTTYRLGGGGNTLTVTNALTGSDKSLVVGTTSSSGTVVLTGTNTYTGATTLNSGTLTLAAATGSAASSAITATGATTVSFDSSTNGVAGTTRAASVTLNGAALNVTGNSTVNSVDTISGALTVTPVNSGTLSSGSVIVPINNTVTVTSNGANAQLVADSLVRSNNAVVLFRGTNLGANTIASATAGTSNISFATAPTGLVGGGGAAGSQNISIIPWAVGDTSATGSGSGFVTYDANGIRPLTSSEYDTSMTGGVSNDHNVKIALPATLTVNGATTVNSLFLTTSLSTGGLLNGTGALTVTSGAVALDYSAVGPNKGAYLEIAKQLDFGTAQGVISSNNTFAANSLFQRGAKISGGISGSGGLVLSTSQLSGGGGITITAATTYTGDTYVLGDLTTTVDNVFPNGGRTGDLYLYGTISIGTANLTMNGLNGSGIIAGSSNARVLTVGSNGAGGSFSGAYLDSGIKGFSFTKAGAGTQVLSGTSSTFAGKTSVQNGILSVVTLNSVTGGTATSTLGTPNNATNGTISLGNLTTTGTLTVVGTGETTDRVINLAGQTGGGTLDQSGTGLLKFTSNFTSPGLAATDQRKTLTLQGSTAGTGEISGAIVDSALGTAGQKATSVTKAGTGTWTLSGTNTYSGATTVSAGTLIVSGSISNSQTTVGTGATLSLAGTAGAVTVNNGTFHLGTAGTAAAVTINNGTFSGAGTVDSLTFTGASAFGPGNSPGTITITDGGSLALSSGTTSTFQFTSSGFGVGTFDLITTPNFATGTIDGTLNLDFTGTGYTAGTGVTFIHLSSLTGTFSSVNVTGLTGLTATVNYGNTPGDISLTLVASAIPEPATCALLGGAGMILFAFGYRLRARRSLSA